MLIRLVSQVLATAIPPFPPEAMPSGVAASAVRAPIELVWIVSNLTSMFVGIAVGVALAAIIIAAINNLNRKK
jgi:hypothetical protein